MEKQVRAVFKLTEKEINEALYDFYVRKLKSNNINAMFSEKDIDVQCDGYLEVTLIINETKEID